MSVERERGPTPARGDYDALGRPWKKGALPPEVLGRIGKDLLHE